MVVAGGDDDIDEGESDPAPESDGGGNGHSDSGDEVVEISEHANVADNGDSPVGPQYRRQVGTPVNLPVSSPVDEPVDPKLHIRWRACFGDMEKSPYLAAFDTQRNVKLCSLSSDAVWEWADGVVGDLKPRAVKIRNLCAVVYPAKQAKGARSIKTLWREV